MSLLREVLIVVFTALLTGAMSAVVTVESIRTEITWIKEALVRHEAELITLRGYR